MSGLLCFGAACISFVKGFSQILVIPGKFLPFSKKHEERQAKLLGHILRSSDADPLRQASFTPSSASRIDYGKKRVGRPRQNWVMFSKNYVYEIKLHLPNCTETAEQDQRVYEAALRKQF